MHGLSRLRLSVLFILVSGSSLWGQNPALGTLQSFKGVDGHNPYPADPTIAAGPSTVVIGGVTTVTVMDKSGNAIDSTDLFTFFGPVRNPQEPVANPRVLFDRGSQRYFLTAQSSIQDPTCQPGGCVSHLFLAVSKSAAPRSINGNDWAFFSTDATMENSTATAYWSDFPGLGVNGDVVVVSSNAVSFATGNADYARLRIFNKTALLNGQASWVDLTHMNDPVNGTPALTFEPVMHIDSSSTFFLVSPSNAYPCGMIVWGISNTLASPTISGSTVQIGGVCSDPTNAIQPAGSTVIVDDSQTILSATPYRNGSLWTTRIVAKDWGSGSVTAIRWNQIDVSQWPTVGATQDGIFGLDGVWHLFPSIAVDAQSNVVICFDRAGLNEFGSVYYAAHLNGDAPGSIRPSVLLKAGTASLTAASGYFGWGNYTGAAVDPNDSSFWIYSEYANNAPDNWATWVGNVAFVSGTQTIQFPALSGVTLGVGPIAVSATASSGLPITFTTATATTCTVSGSTVTVSAAGTCSIVAYQQGNSAIAAAPPITQSFTVNPTNQAFIKPNGVAAIYSSSTTIEPGSWVWIFGNNLSQTSRFWNPATEIVNGALPTSLDGVSVQINGKPAYVYYISPGQINVQAPDDGTTGPVNVTVTNSTGTSNVATVTLGAVGPSFFTYGDQYAVGVIPASDGGYTLMGPTGRYGFGTRPVHAGEVLELYGTGFGVTSPTTPAGQVVQTPAQVSSPVVVTIGGVAQSVAAYVTEAGVWQMNVTVPAVAAGDVALTATVNGVETPDDIVIAVQ